MRSVKIVADSSADILQLQTGADFAAAPLKIITAQREFVDDSGLDVEAMVRFFDSYKGTSKTSCPNPSDWLESFGDAEDVFCVAITSGLSGSYNAACAAKQMYEAEYPGRRVCVIDSLSAGPELKLIVEKLEEEIAKGTAYEDLCHQIREYQQQTGLLFMLESLKNFAANGRVSPAVAKLVGILGIRVVGKASDEGTLEPMHKCRGEAKSLDKLLQCLQNSGLCRGKVRIDHCQNPDAAQQLQKKIQERFPASSVEIGLCRGLCSFYAEKGGLLVGFEKF